MNTKNQRYSPSRREMIKKMMSFSSAAVCAPFVITPSRGVAQKQQRIVVRDSGGIMSTIYQDVFYKPFTQSTGIQVIGTVASVEPAAQIRTMVDTGVLHWDMAAIGHRSIALLTADKVYLEPHGLEHDPIVSAIPQNSYRLMGLEQTSILLCWHIVLISSKSAHLKRGKISGI